jgi:hypothetical protein
LAEVEIHPRFSEQDHERFRRYIGPGVPTTYEKWIATVERRKADAKQNKRKFVEIDITADEYIRYCAREQENYHWVSLDRFTEKKYNGESY